ncbi:complex I subunit 5 family protein [Caldivirga sp.]|uniref:complex I subunit 5 family protein n=1 Tax=Caldivirga sp. TaxID=2080243 RepID=UPI003D0E75BE
MILSIDYALLTSLSLPILATVVSAISKNRKISLYFSTTSFVVLAVYALYGIVAGLNQLTPIGLMPKPIGELLLVSDGLSNSFGLTIALVSAMVMLASETYMEHRFRELGISGDESWRTFYSLYDAYAISMAWLVYSYNLLLTYIALELSLVFSFLLIYLYGYGNRRWVGILYFVWTHVAGVLFLTGVILVGYITGTLNMATLKVIPLTAWVLMLVGLLIKLPSYGPHVWLPWAHAEAPTPVSALLSPLTVGLAAYILARLYLISPQFINSIRDYLLLYAILGGVLAGFAVFRQSDYKRLLAYSTVANMAYLLTGLTLGPYGIIGLTLQYMAHAFGKAILFMTAGAIIVAYETRDINKMGGLHTYIPSVSNVALLGWMSLAGIFTIGLLAEFFIFIGLVNTMGFNVGTLWAFIGIALLFILTGYYGFWTLKRIFYGQPRWPYSRVRVSNELVAPLYILGIISIILLFPPVSTFIVHSLVNAIQVMAHV